ncbi:MAG: AAA family ATPase [Elusimicrobiota bacterium]|nr:AAA family ATPase [Elusimicrobiota bacterium]
MTVEKTTLRKSLALTLALALGLLPGGGAWAANTVARPVVTAGVSVPGVGGVAGVGVMSRVSLPSLSLVSGIVPAPTLRTEAPTLAPSAALEAAASPVAGAVVAGPAAAGVERHPIVGILNDLRARGVVIPETLTAADAPALVSLAENLPAGTAKQEILGFAHALGQRGGSVDASAASGRMFDGAGKAADKAVDAVVAAAPQGIVGRAMARLSRAIGRGAPEAAPKEPARPANPRDFAVAINELRWVPADKDLPASTRDMKPVDRQLVGQDEALKAMRFGLQMGVSKDGRMEGRHYNMFVSGPEGSGRETALRHLLEDIAPKMKTPDDIVAATNFDHPDKPIILSLPAGKAIPFAKAVRGFVNQAKATLPKALDQGPVGQQKKQIMAAIRADFDKGVAEIQAAAKAVAMPEGYALDFVVSHSQEGTSFGTRLLYKGKPVKEGASAPNLEQAVAKLNEVTGGFQERFMAMAEKNNEMLAAAADQIMKAEMQGAAQILSQMAQGILAAVMPEQASSPELEKLQQVANAWQEQFAAKVAAVSVEGFGLALMPSNNGINVAFTYEGKPLSKQKMEELMSSGALNPAKWSTIQDRLKLEAKALITEFKTNMEAFNAEAQKIAEKNPQAQGSLGSSMAMAYVQNLVRYAATHYQLFLGRAPAEESDESNPLAALMGGPRVQPADAADHFRVSVLVNNARTQGAPVIWEKNPTFENLFGLADDNARMGMMGMMPIKTEGVGGPSLKSGSFHKANGGFLILNVMDVLREPGVWPALMRAVRNGDAEITEGGLMGMMRGRGVSYSVPTKVKVVLVGSPSLRMMLSHYDEDFGLNFQAVAELEPRVPITEGTIAGYAQFIKNSVALSGGELLEFSRGAISAVLEQAARLADSHKRMTAQFGALHGLLREASFWARESGRDEVRREDVARALKEKQDREETYRRHLIEIYKQNVFVVETDGKSEDQINGLAVMGSFGVPMRVTFTVSRAAGAGGIVSVDRNAGSTGKSFNKALGVVEGFLERLFAKDKVFPAKITVSYEQNYGGIDGDSATSTEIYGILASLAGAPLAQNIAITGSADQKGNVQAIGGVNEKIEGFFELAKSRGLTGEQGIIIPKSNVADLQLNPEVVEAVAQGKFHIYAVDHVSQGVEILTGVAYSEILARAELRLKDMRLAGMREQIEAKKELGIK